MVRDWEGSTRSVWRILSTSALMKKTDSIAGSSIIPTWPQYSWRPSSSTTSSVSTLSSDSPQTGRNISSYSHCWTSTLSTVKLILVENWSIRMIFQRLQNWSTPSTRIQWSEWRRREILTRTSDFMRCSWSLSLPLSLSVLSWLNHGVRNIFNVYIFNGVITFKLQLGHPNLYLDEDGLKYILYHDSIYGPIVFILTFSLSVFSASLGLAKCLKSGVARTISAGGCLDGLLSARHLLAFFACGVCLVARGLCLGLVSFVSNLLRYNQHLII